MAIETVIMWTVGVLVVCTIIGLLCGINILLCILDVVCEVIGSLL